MTNFTKGDWVEYRYSGFSVTKMVLAVRPDGVLVTGDHTHDTDNHTVDPEHTDVEKVRG